MKRRVSWLRRAGSALGTFSVCESRLRGPGRGPVRRDSNMAGSMRTKLLLIGGAAFALGAAGVAAFSTAQASGPQITVYKSPT